MSNNRKDVTPETNMPADLGKMSDAELLRRSPITRARFEASIAAADAGKLTRINLDDI